MKNIRDATDSTKGTLYQVFETLLSMVDNNVKQIEYEGIEDIDKYTIDGTIVLIQNKYHSKTTSGSLEGFGYDSGIYKVYKSFIFYNDKYENVSSIVYDCVCEHSNPKLVLGFNDTSEFITNFNDKDRKKHKVQPAFLNYLKKDLLAEQNKRYAAALKKEEKRSINKKKSNITTEIDSASEVESYSEDIPDWTLDISKISEILDTRMPELNKKFCDLIDIRLTKDAPFDIDMYYQKITSNERFCFSIGKDSDYAKVYLFQKVFAYFIDNLFNNENKIIIIDDFIQYINNSLSEDINVNTIVESLAKYIDGTPNCNCMFILDAIMNNPSVDACFAILNNIEPYPQNITSSCVVDPIQVIRNKAMKKIATTVIANIDPFAANYSDLFKSTLTHLQNLHHGKCCYEHYTNIQEGRYFNSTSK